MPDHLPDNLDALLADLAQQCRAQRVVLFASRARGDSRERNIGPLTALAHFYAGK